MNISEFFRITPDNIVQCVNYIVTLKTLKSVKYLNEGYDDPDNFDLNFEYFLNEDESDSYKTDYVDKHKLLSIQNVEKLNNPYTWMEGIKLRTDDPYTELAEIVKYGSKEAYEASLPEAQDEFNLDMDYRMSKMELGL